MILCHGASKSKGNVRMKNAYFEAIAYRRTHARHTAGSQKLARRSHRRSKTPVAAHTYHNTRTKITSKTNKTDKQDAPRAPGHSSSKNRRRARTQPQVTGASRELTRPLPITRLFHTSSKHQKCNKILPNLYVTQAGNQSYDTSTLKPTAKRGKV